ncbi:MAG: hypothetical protein HY396_02670 [Candidatus Doudnabacteria bacterium]|nr:hypothetical protein [Candidatus Doudnabacteria bacterium]
MTALQSIYSIYNQFLSYFPERTHGLVSLFLAILLIIGIYKVLKKQFIYLILLVVLLPASVPILKSIWEQLLALLKFLLSKK